MRGCANLKTYAEITAHEVKIFSSQKSRNVTCFLLPLEENAVYISTGSVVLVANMRQVATYVVDMPDKENDPRRKIESLAKLLPKRKLKRREQWNLVKSVFPIGDKMNEKTHIFDGVMLTNKVGLSRFYMTALSMDVANDIAEIGMQLFGSEYRLKRLDTMEHLLFRYYMRQTLDPLLVVFPQHEGFGILLLTDGLPKAAWSISNYPEFRENEFLRYFKTAQELATVMQEEDDEQNKTTLKKAVVLGGDLDWIYQILEASDVMVERRDYCLSALV